MLSTAQITAVYQAACLVVTAEAEREHMRAAHASPPSQWPSETQVQGWPQPAQDAYRAAMDRYVRALNQLARLVPEAEAPLHILHERQHLVRVAYDDIVGDPRGGKVITVAVYPLLIPTVSSLSPE